MAAAPYAFGEKDPGSENDPFTFDLTSWLKSPVTVPGTVYTIVGVVTASVTPTDMHVGDTVYSGGYVTVYLSGGTEGVTYTIKIYVTRVDQNGNTSGPIPVGATITCVTPVAAQ